MMDRNPHLGTRGRSTTGKNKEKKKEKNSVCVVLKWLTDCYHVLYFLGDVKSEVMTYCSCDAQERPRVKCA